MACGLIFLCLNTNCPNHSRPSVQNSKENLISSEASPANFNLNKVIQIRLPFLPWVDHVSIFLLLSRLFFSLPCIVIGDHIECIDGSMCMKGETCCKTPTEKYSCCSIPDAICCADGKHCCPSGTK